MKGSSEPRAGVVKRQTLESGSNPGSAKFETWFEKLMIIQTLHLSMTFPWWLRG